MPAGLNPRTLRLALATAAVALVAAGVAGTLARASSSPPPGAPVQVYAIGDSITDGWGAVGDAAAHPEKSWSTGTDAGTGSWVQRLAERLPAGSSVTGTNLAVAGSKTTDANGVAVQAASVGSDATIVLVGAGSADLCMSDVVTPSSLTTPTDFRQKIDQTLATISSRAPSARILVASIPNWYRLWQDIPDKPQRFDASRGWTCPLLFKTTAPAADDTTRAAFKAALEAYNAALADACAAVAACRYDGGAANAIVLTEADVSTTDYFHPSSVGQQKLAAATWRAGWYSVTQDTVTGLAAAAGVERVTLTWDALPAGATAVVVRQKAGSSPTDAADGALAFSGIGTGATVTGLTGGTSYYFAAFPVDVDGDVGHAAVVSATPIATTTTPAVTTTPAPPAVTTTTPASSGSDSPYVASDGNGAAVAVAATAAPGRPDLAVTVAPPATRVLVGDSLTYTFTVTDRNHVAAANGKVTFDVPATATLVSIAGDRNQTCSTSSARVVCALDFAAATAPDAVFRLVLAVGRAGELGLSATVASDQEDAAPADNRVDMTLTASARLFPSVRSVQKAHATAKTTRGIALVTAAVAVGDADRVEVSILPAASEGAPAPLLRGSIVGSAKTGRLHRAIVLRAAAGGSLTVPIRLRVRPETLRARNGAYVVQVVVGSSATGDRAVLRLPFHA